MAAVATFYHLPSHALPAIHAAENGRAGMVRHNKNGSDDLGAMQINTLWLPTLSQGTGLPAGRLRNALIREDCFNVAVAGAILRIYLHESGDLITAIGYYHSHTPALREAYEMRVLATSLLTMPLAPASSAPGAAKRSTSVAPR
jgi:hypothetical protein